MIGRGFTPIALGLAALLLSRPALACSCVGPFPEEWRTEATLVFRGRVTSTRQLRAVVEINVVRYNHEASEVTFRVLERFKGPQSSTYVVLYGECLVQATGGGECLDMCSSRTAPQGEWVVFAFLGEAGRPATSDCSAYPIRKDHRAAYSLDRLRAGR